MEDSEKRLQEQKKILEKGEQKTSEVLKSLLSKSIDNIKNKKRTGGTNG